MHSEVKSSGRMYHHRIIYARTVVGSPNFKACLTRFCRSLSQVRTRFAVIANIALVHDYRLTPCEAPQTAHYSYTTSHNTNTKFLMAWN